MAIKGAKTKTITALGVNGSLSATPQYASEIVDLRFDSNLGAWISDRSLQPYWKFPNNFVKPTATPAFYFDEKVDSFYFWKRPGSGEVYIFVEQAGTLYYFFGNKGQGTSYTGTYYENDIHTVDDKRHIPKAGEAGTQYIPYGSKLLIINGYDKPIWFGGNGNWRDFSFTFPAPDIFPANVQANYQQGEELEYGTGAPWFSTSSTLGLGDIDHTLNQYGYRMSWITEDGAESPLSSPWYEVWRVPDNSGTAEYKYGIYLELPFAPEGCVARRLYRTKNMKDSKDTTGEFFFLKEIKENSSEMYIDYMGDTFLVSLAPSATASSMIRSDYAYGENWDGRVWLAKGDTVIYSDKGIPEQFAATSYFDLGNTVGGKVTQIKAYYNNLIIFRENAVNIVRPNGSGGYTFSTVSTSIGTVASNAIQFVPRLGLTFVTVDGIYSLTGGFDGGSRIEIKKISDAVNEEWKTCNDASIARVTSAYSDVEKELWIHYPADYSTVPSRGIVIHTDMQEPQFSFRKALNPINDNLWTFNRLGVDEVGRFIVGSSPNWTDDNNIDSRTTLFGPLHVWCASHFHGQTATITSNVDGTITYQVAQVLSTKKSWESSWIEFEGAKVRVFSVEVDIIAWGDVEMKVAWYADHFLTDNETKPQKQAYSDYVFTKEEPPVSVGPAGANGVTNNPFIVGESLIHGHRKITLRFDVNTGLVGSFKFKLLGEILDPFTVVSYRLTTSSEAIKPLNQSINLNAGSPR
jgi:hypothetical protein